MHHKLNVGEVYDKAIDLYVRNAGVIALTLGVLSLVVHILEFFAGRFEGNSMLAAMHLRQHESMLQRGWFIAPVYLLHSIVMPMVLAALCARFDHALRGHTIGLKECFTWLPQRLVNIITAWFVLNAVLLGAPYAIAFGYVVANAEFTRLIIWVPTVAALGLMIWPTALLTIGAATAFARVAIDAGRVLQSIRFSIAGAFKYANHRQAIAVGLPLLLLFEFFNIGRYYGGVVAFGLTGADAANVIMQSVGDVIAWSLVAAVATVYYRNLTPSA